MAIGTGDAVEKFGTQVAVTNAGVAINSGAMSVQADAVAWTNSNDAPEADMLLEATFAAAPNANSSIEVFGRKLNVRSTNDENIPTLTDNEDKYLGSFILDSGAGQTNQIKTARVPLDNGKASQEWEFYYKNLGGQNVTMQGWITPITSGPAA